MDTAHIVSILQQSIYLIAVFAVFLMLAMWKGRQFLINLILALYFALLISLKFPYYDRILGSAGVSGPMGMIIIFAVFTVLALFLFNRLMPNDFTEPAFESFGHKVLSALFASILVMAYSFHVLPITDIITPGSPIQALFGPEDRFFWWLMVPLVGLFFL